MDGAKNRLPTGTVIAESGGTVKEFDRRTKTVPLDWDAGRRENPKFEAILSKMKPLKVSPRG